MVQATHLHPVAFEHKISVIGKHLKTGTELRRQLYYL